MHALISSNGRLNSRNSEHLLHLNLGLPSAAAEDTFHLCLRKCSRDTVLAYFEQSRFYCFVRSIRLSLNSAN
jgi:hypothetical protein